MADVAADVPSKYDVVINGHGYIFWRQLMQSLPFRNQRAAYSYTPTFIERTNVSGAYGDDQQDFFLTASQNDWSLGQGQHFFRSGNADSARKFWSGSNIEVITEGAAAIRPHVTSTPTAALVSAACPASGVTSGDHLFVTTTKLYSLVAGATATDLSAHGAGQPCVWGLATDGKYAYIAGGSKIRSWDGSSFADFSASSNVGSIATLNNSLYSCNGSTLNVYSTSGVQSTLFTWQDNKGGARQAFIGGAPKLVPFGGHLLIFFPQMNGCPQLWMYDGNATSKLADLPESSIGYDIKVEQGTVFMSAQVISSLLALAAGFTNVIYYWNNGTLDELWRSPTQSAPAPALGTHRGNLFFTDNGNQDLYEYNLTSGAVSHAVALGTTDTTVDAVLSSSQISVMMVLASSSDLHARGFPDSSAFASTATLTTSNFDFENSLTKIFRGVKVEYDGGGTIDISYLIDGNIATDMYTSLQASATGGIEYLFPANTRGRTISIQLLLSNNGAGGKAILKRLYVRAAPVQQSYRRCQYVLDLTGGAPSAGGIADTLQLMNGAPSALTGAQMATNLVTAITSGAPFSVTDRFSTYTAVFEQGEGITEIDEVKPGEFVAQVTLREV